MLHYKSDTNDDKAKAFLNSQNNDRVKTKPLQIVSILINRVCHPQTHNGMYEPSLTRSQGYWNSSGYENIFLTHFLLCILFAWCFVFNRFYCYVLSLCYIICCCYQTVIDYYITKMFSLYFKLLLFLVLLKILSFVACLRVVVNFLV